MSYSRQLIAVIIAVMSLSGIAAAQDKLSDAKALYDKAAYEEALKLLDQVTGSDVNPEVHQYRALCLIALGRAEAAERAIAIVVAANPFFAPDPREVAPRVVSMFAETRRKLLPQMVRRAFTDARTLFRDGDRQRANERFDEVLRLLADASLSEDPDLDDMKLLANGFMDLVRSQPSAPQASQPAPPASSLAPAVASTEEPAPRETPGPVVVTPPVAITQSLPQWRPPDAATARRAYSGSVRVMIDAEGKVTAAEMQRSVFPPYDRAVLEAAKGWLYTPAMRDGKPIGSETTVEIRLGPPPRN